MAALPNCPACRAQNAGSYLAHVTEDAADSYSATTAVLADIVGYAQGPPAGNLPRHATFSEAKDLSRTVTGLRLLIVVALGAHDGLSGKAACPPPRPPSTQERGGVDD